MLTTLLFYNGIMKKMATGGEATPVAVVGAAIRADGGFWAWLLLAHCALLDRVLLCV